MFQDLSEDQVKELLSKSPIHSEFQKALYDKLTELHVYVCSGDKEGKEQSDYTSFKTDDYVQESYTKDGEQKSRTYSPTVRDARVVIKEFNKEQKGNGAAGLKESDDKTCVVCVVNKTLSTNKKYLVNPFEKQGRDPYFSFSKYFGDTIK